jgi:hypothetical protein
MRNYILIAVLTLILAAMTPPCLAGGFTSEQIEQGRIQVRQLEKQGTREVSGTGVYYIWHGDWYAMSYDRQLRTMRAIADAEYTASQGRYTHMHIEYEGSTVAEATPTGGIRVIKSRP